MSLGINYPPPPGPKISRLLPPPPWSRNFRKIRGKTFFLSVPKFPDFCYIRFLDPQKPCFLKVSRLAAIFFEVSAGEAGRKFFSYGFGRLRRPNNFLLPPPLVPRFRVYYPPPPGPEKIPKKIGRPPLVLPRSISE